MGGLLDGAKKKIWAICNQIAGGRPTPALRVGLVAYRDKGDDYVTQVTDLSRDLDGHILPGVPRSVLRGGRFDGVRVISKSGAFGERALLRCLLGLDTPFQQGDQP